jgi:hypothetical protein
MSINKLFGTKLKELLTLIERWLPIPSDNSQLEVWIESADKLAYSFEFSDVEQEYVDKILDIYEEQFKALIIKNTEKEADDIPAQHILDELFTRKQLEQRSPEWYAQMSTILSASEFGTLFAAPRTRAKMVVSKTEPYVARNNPLAVLSNSMSAFDWGIRFEPVVKQIYEHKYGVEVRELGRLHHPIDPRCTASPDGLIYKCNNPAYASKKGRLIEIKCPVTREIDGSIPKDYYTQMQMQLQVTGLKKCDYVEAQFASQYNYNPIKEGPACYCGNIALVRYKDATGEYGTQEYYYMYGPVNESEWKPVLDNGDEVVEIIPWRLLQWAEQVVQRNDEWWENVQPAINNFWEDVEKAKRGEFVVPESTRPKKLKEEKCIIVFKMDTE